MLNTIFGSWKAPSSSGSCCTDVQKQANTCVVDNFDFAHTGCILEYELLCDLLRGIFP